MNEGSKYKTSLQGVEAPIQALPNQKNLSRNVRRIRQANRDEPDIPTDNDFDIPDAYRVTTSGEEFLIDDNGDPDNRIIIFGAPWALELLEENSHWGVSSLRFILIDY